MLGKKLGILDRWFGGESNTTKRERLGVCGHPFVALGGKGGGNRQGAILSSNAPPIV